jgi:DNA gyrase subunit A
MDQIGKAPPAAMNPDVLNRRVLYVHGFDPRGVEEIRKDREAIVITAIPYQVNKASLVERIAPS